MTFKLSVRIVEPSNYAALVESTTEVWCHQVNAAAKYYLAGVFDGVKLTIYKIEGSNDELLYGITHVLLGQR